MSLEQNDDKPAPQPEPEQEDPAKPILSIDKTGYLAFSIPLYKTPEIFARGMVDFCRTEILKWYLVQGQKQRDMATLAAKTGFQRFKDKLKL